MSNDPRFNLEGFSRGTGVAMLCLALVKIWLTRALPLTVIADSDEKTFLLQAEGLLSGHWLGDYTVVTIVKMPVYSMFLAASFLAGVPALLAQQLLYVVCCAVFVVAVRPALDSWRAYKFVLLYALLVFNPMTFLGGERLIRNRFYASLGVLLISGAVGTITRLDWNWKSLLKWPLLFSCALAAQWLTREESFWVVPFLLIYTAVAGWLLWRSKASNWRRNVAFLVLPYSFVGAAVITVEALNNSKYGVFTANEQQSREFKDLMGALYRVNPTSPRRRFVVVPKEVRERIYAVSPAFAELRGALEGAVGQQWATPSCRVNQVCTDNDVVWGWFMWEIRHAALVAGHQGNAAEAARFYKQIAREINAACADGRLSCQAPRSSSTPPWEGSSIRGALVDYWKTLRFVVSFDGFSLQPGQSLGNPALLAEYSELALQPVSSTTSQLSLSGWALSTKSAVELSVRDENGQPADFAYQKVARPDVAEAAKKLGYQQAVTTESGFQLKTSCSKNCSLYVRGGPDPTKWQKAIALDGSVKYYFPAVPSSQGKPQDPFLTGLLTGDVMLYLDSISTVDAPRGNLQARVNSLKLSVLDKISFNYQRIIPLAFTIACLLFAVEWLQSLRHRKASAAVLACTLVLLLFLNRLAVLVVMDELAIPGISRIAEYEQYVYPLILMFVGHLVLNPSRAFLLDDDREGR